MGYVFLVIAIAGEIVGTTALKASDGFSKLGASVIAVLAYSVTFYFLSLALKTISTGVAYAIWSGLEIVVLSVIAWVWYKQRLDTAALIGLAMIVGGVVFINVFSNSASH